ncbi:MAG: malate dehydrogenase [Anaerolineaceae bacterium]|nr:malate dehydrogenase [Anaerolineaceae bacterium]MBN2678086.1 malate dehydrogenase [Anaerolineaceae bacterium]
MIKITSQEALDYHRYPSPGKMAIIPTKPLTSQRDLSLAYTPGVAHPVLAIDKHPDDVYQYTARGNLVGVISNGTAILGLGDRGALASKPVMEGKAILFKKFAGIDAFDIEIDCQDPGELIEIIASLAPTFGGINLEDIKSPECFQIEAELIKRLDIPVFHDDQHGTAIILSAGLLNALELVRKTPTNIKVVFSGAGAAGVACANQLVALGVPREQIWMCDIAGLIYHGRIQDMFPEKAIFAQGDKPGTLADVIEAADVFIGLSAANLVTPEMLKRMRADPIIFAMANPDPEISYDLARATRPDAIVATGRSDLPNQINNILGFPYIFRGALDVRARAINPAMKVAASQALAKLAKENVPEEVLHAYQLDHLEFGRDYIVPKPLDRRVCLWEAPAVAQAAMDSGLAQNSNSLEQYRYSLSERLGL